MDGWTDTRTHVRVDGRTDGWWMDGWMDGYLARVFLLSEILLLEHATVGDEGLPTHPRILLKIPTATGVHNQGCYDVSSVSSTNPRGMNPQDNVIRPQIELKRAQNGTKQCASQPFLDNCFKQCDHILCCS